MKIGIMQPYIFPYIGYFQLVFLVEKFVFYDDVNFIKQGWINRNRILLDNKEFLYTIPLKDASSFKLINPRGTGSSLLYFASSSASLCSSNTRTRKNNRNSAKKLL